MKRQVLRYHMCQEKTIMYTKLVLFYYYYVFHGRVALFFADSFSTECRITMKFLHNFFYNPEEILRSHIMFINASTKEFTLVNTASPSHDVAFEHLLYYKMVANVY